MKLILPILLLFSSAKCFAQNIPNGGFENWVIEDFYTVDDWISYGKPLRDENAQVGKYAIRLQNYENGADILPSSLYNIDWSNGTIDKFPYDGDPLSMVFYANYDLAAGDSAHIITAFYEKGSWIGDVEIDISGHSNNKYLKYSVPIQWYTSRTPDSVYVGMKSINHDGNANGVGHIIIDDFHFENIGKRTVEITNHDFENWTNSGVLYPEYWYTIDLYAFQHWGGFLRNKSVVENRTQAFRGEKCLAIQNFVSWDNNGEGFCFTGDTPTHGWRPSFALDKKYTYLQGYYKLHNGGNDTAQISFNFFRNGQYLAEGGKKFFRQTDEWTFFDIPVTYYADIKPDSATLRLSASINEDNNSENTVFLLDELKFVTELDNRVSVQNTQLVTNRVYPNPFNSLLHIYSNSGLYIITNVAGQSITEGQLTEGKNTINMHDIKSGIYILNIIDNEKNTWKTKIIKQ